MLQWRGMADIGGWSAQACALLQQGQSLVLVTVVQSRGSAPRDGGAKLWVSAGQVFGTIGGGHLEYKAIDQARQMLQPGNSVRRDVQRYALGPGLGQCCGGVVWLAYEVLRHVDAVWCRQVAERLQQGQPVCRVVDFSTPDAPVMLEPAGATLADFNTDRALWDDTSRCLRDTLAPAALTVVVCGAGHVGQAIVNLLATLPVSVIWLDPRDDVWPAIVPPNVRVLQGDDTDVPDCPDNACWLVLTHSHALDLALVQAIMAQKPFRFLGLIGSQTKNARFVTRLLQRFEPALVQRMTCPIGLVQTRSKLPEVIAVSVVAQLLALN